MIEMSPNSYAKQCGVCHAGGGQMEYDRNMGSYGAGSPSGDRFTYLNPAKNGTGVDAGRIVDISTDATIQHTSLYGENKAEVDCLLCHMQEVRPSAAYYKNTLLCSSAVNTVGPADNPRCGDQKVVFMDMNTNTPMMMPDDRFSFSTGDFYDTFNRNIAISLGYFKQAATAGIGAGIDLATGVLSGVPSTIDGSKIGATKSVNCAACHARTEQDNIGLPGEAQAFGGMIAGFGNYVRLYEPGTTFDWDKIAADGTCSGDCFNSTRWMEFGCKTGMGKRSQKSGVGSSDRWANGFCLICDSQNQWSNPASFCYLPSVQASCNTKAGADIVADGSTMSLIDMTAQGPMPKVIPGKMPDTDVHDASPKGMTCASCHYQVDGATNTPRTISGNGATYTYPATSYKKMDHQLARGYSMLEQAGNETDGMVTCAGCHIQGENHHPNAAALNAPIAGHAGFPALHFEKIDCRTCHIPAVYSSPGRLLFRDWTAGAYRQGEGSNGNANHFDFAMDMLEGSMAPMRPIKLWMTTPEGTKISPALPSLLPTWTGSAIPTSNTNSVMGWSPAKTRDITASAALVAKSGCSDCGNIRLNGTNEHPPFQGFTLTDPLKIETKTQIDAMAAELGRSDRTGLVAHAKVRDARINLFPIFFDPSHGVTPKTFALGAPSKGGCVMCHSSSNPASPNYSPYSVGFFDSEKEFLQNGMMQMANADCDNPYMFNLLTTGDPNAGTTPTCIENSPVTGACDGSAYGTTSTGVRNGTMGLCKEQIGGMLAGQMGMTPDAMMRMDGVEFMQMMAIKEGGTAAGCNPMMSIFFGQTAPQIGNCGPYMYTRDEIRSNFAKMLQQSTFTPEVAGKTWTNPITGVSEAVPATMRRVFGIVSVAKNPGNPSHANKFDFGATCYNPLDMTHSTTFPCSEAQPGMSNIVKTFVKANELLGYTDTYVNYLMGIGDKVPSTPTTATSPTARFSYMVSGMTLTVDGSASMKATSYSWNFGDLNSANTAAAVHTYAAAGTYNVSLTVTGESGETDTKTFSVTIAAPNRAPVASATYTASGNTITVTNTSTDPDGDALSVLVNWGDGNSQAIVNTASHTYADGTYTIRISATDRKGGNSISEVATLTLPAEQGAVIGLVADSAGSGLSGAIVSLWTGPSTTLLQQVYTSATGTFTLSNVKAGSYTVKTSKLGFVFPDIPVTVTTGTVDVGTIQAQALHQISGTITTGTPAAGVNGIMVQLRDGATNAVLQQVLTNGSGVYTFPNLADGTYTVDPQPTSGTTTPEQTTIVVSGADVSTGTDFTYAP